MMDVQASIYAAVIGVVSGFLISIPVGPINLAIINEGAKRGFKWGVLIGFGAIAMDIIYCGVAFAGFSGLFSTRLLRATIELLSFLALIYLGVKYLQATNLPATTKSVEMVEHKLHPHTAFMIGFVRVLGNPAVLLFWITLSASFMSHEWIDDTWTTKAACVVGMATGAFAWFVLLSFLVSLGHGRFSAKTLLRMSHVSGACLLLAAVVVGIRLVKLLAHR
ncbi:MAG: LysE family transporter [Verrucomicrobiota bacterium]